MVRVAIFTDNDFEKINGVTTTLKAVLRFTGAHAEARVYTAAGTGVATPTYFATPSVGIGLPFYREMRVYWPRVRRLAAEVRRQRADVVHVTTPGPIGVAARWIAARLRLPLVGSYHTELGEYIATLSGSKTLGHIGEQYVRRYYRHCDPLLVPSAATRDLLVDRRYPSDRLRIWERGVDAQQFTPTRTSAVRRQAWRVHQRRPAILYTGRISREKGLDLIAPVRQQLLSHGLDHQFVFAGDGPMRKELEALCPDGIFLGALPHDEVASVMASADLFFFPSATDTLGNVVLEAQASGLPVVVSDRGGPPQNIVARQTGLVCTAGDAKEFARAVATLVAEPRRRIQMGRQARTYAETRDWPKAMAPLIDAWREAARRPARAPQSLGIQHRPVFTEEATR